MSKSLKSMAAHDRERTINRRLSQSEAKRGLGYWAAVDAKKKVRQACSDS